MAKISSIYGTLGISDTEQQIMLAISHPLNVQGVARQTGISRTGIQYCLSSLLRRGLVRVIRNGKHKTYATLTHDELVDLLQQAVDDLKTGPAKKKGARIKTTKEDEFIIHVGTQEIIPAYERIASGNKNERIKAIQHYRSFNELSEKLTTRQLAAFNRSIIKNDLIIDGILNKSAYEIYQKKVLADPRKYAEITRSLEGRMADYGYFADTMFDHAAELWLFRNTSLIINWHDEIAIEITNRSMTAFLKDMFEFVKKDSPKIDHNKAMRNILESEKKTGRDY